MTSRWDGTSYGRYQTRQRPWNAGYVCLPPPGALVLVEGFWHTGAGITEADMLALVSTTTQEFRLRRLSNESALWSGLSRTSATS